MKLKILGSFSCTININKSLPKYWSLKKKKNIGGTVGAILWPEGIFSGAKDVFTI